MIVECSKRPDGWKPVKGNEKKIENYLVKCDYYEQYSIEKDGDYFEFSYTSTPSGDEIFSNEKNNFVKFNDDGSISVSDGEPSFKDYVAMEFNLTDDFDWVKWLFNAPNVKSLHRNHITDTINAWDMTPIPFQMQRESILIFNKNSKTLHDVLNGTSVTIYDTLLGNGYVVHENSINQEIRTLDAMLRKPMNLKERMDTISRVSYLRSMKRLKL